MSEFTSGNAPGFQSQIESQDSQVWWSGRHGQNLVATKRVTIDSSNLDSGNTPTTTLRGGVLLAIEDATGNAYLYDADANDGRQIAVGILEKSQDMLVDGVASNRYTQMLVHGLLKESQLVGTDDRAKTQLANRFVFDSDLGVAGGELMHPRGVYRVSTNQTLTASQNGLMFIALAAVTFTLPTKANGLAYRVFQIANANLTIVGNNDIVHKGDASASTVAFSTASQKIGSHALIECMYTADNTLKWVVSNLGGTTATVS